MNLHEIGVRDLRSAIDAYLSIARPDGGDAGRPDLEGVEGQVAGVLDRFEDESRHPGAATMRRYALRLGNARFRGMKLALTEYLVPGDWFFVVDSHDEVDIEPSYPDYGAWLELRAFNRRIKDEIESRWREVGLPTMRDLERHPALRPAAPPPAGAPLVVLLEDDDDIRRATALALQKNGWRVETAADGVEGLAKIVDLRPDLVVLDHIMPGRTGYEVCREIRATPGLRTTPLLLTTATPLSARKCEAADAVLYKPFAERHLASWVADLLQLKTPRA